MTFIILLDRFYVLLERTIASLHTMRRHLHHMDHPSDLLCHPLELGCNQSKVGGKVLGKVVVDLVELVSEVVVDWVVLLMRLPYHQSIPHHPRDFHTTRVFHTTLLDFHTTRVFHTTPRDFRYPCHPTIITISPTLEATLPSTTSLAALPPIDETMIDFVIDLGACPPRQPCAPHTRRVVPS